MYQEQRNECLRIKIFKSSALMDRGGVIKSFSQWLARYRFAVIIVALSQFSRSVLSGDTKSIVLASSNVSAELYSVGYNGSWSEFCNETEIENEFPTWTRYETRKLRILICAKKAEKGIDATTRKLLAAYKYCEMVKPQVYGMFDELVSKLSQDDRRLKVRILARARPGDNTSACYRDTTTELDEHCIGRQNPYFVMYTHVLGRTCAIGFLATEDIISYMRILCAGRRFTGNIDWPSLIASVNVTIADT